MQLHFKSYGAGEPLIILHGLFGSLDNWHTVGAALARHVQVFVLDQRNHGRSPHSDELTYAAMAGDLREFFESHSLPSASLFGHSMGGKTAMQFAADHPEMVDRLIVADIAPRAYPPLHDAILDALLSVDFRHVRSRADADRVLAGHIGDRAVRQFLLKNLMRNKQGGFRWKMNLDAIAQNYQDLAAAVRIDRPFEKPALFLRALRSDYITEDDSSAIRRSFPNAVIVPLDSGHWIHVDVREEMLRLVIRFLKGAIS